MSKLALPKLIAIGAAALFLAGAATLHPHFVSAAPTMLSGQVAGDDLKQIGARANQYFDAAFSNNPSAFYATLAPDYVGVDRNGAKLSPGTVFGKIQGLKILDGRKLDGVSVGSASRTGNGIVASVDVSASAHVVDQDGVSSETSTYPHTLTFVPGGNGGLLIARDVGSGY
jgi:hypothetical protein